MAPSGNGIVPPVSGGATRLTGAGAALRLAGAGAIAAALRPGVSNSILTVMLRWYQSQAIDSILPEKLLRTQSILKRLGAARRSTPCASSKSMGTKGRIQAPNC